MFGNRYSLATIVSCSLFHQCWSSLHIELYFQHQNEDVGTKLLAIKQLLFASILSLYVKSSIHYGKLGLAEFAPSTNTNGLKTVDTIGNCQRPVFSLAVPEYMHKITNLWKFELNRSSKLRDNNERKQHPCYTKLCAFKCLISRPQILNLRSRNQIRGKLLLSRKLCHFRGSRLSQCFILSTAPHIACYQVSCYVKNHFE